MPEALGEKASVAGPRAYLLRLQDEICAAVESREPEVRFDARVLGDATTGESRPRVLNSGSVFERAAVNFSHTRGDRLPPAATERRPELAGKPFKAVSLSLILHPVNPYAPTTHMNLRFFFAGSGDGVVWWFGGGFDLTPYYGFEDDAVHWHANAKAACDPFGTDRYPRFKEWCDRYFFLPHRQEARGIGGLFFDDLAESSFEDESAFWRSVGDHFASGYFPILDRRRDLPFGERERSFQRYRRGRYVEFNLLYDRGTRYGLQSGRRIESVLASMPPEVSWRYDWTAEPGSAEEELVTRFLPPRDWVDAAVD